MRIYLEIQIEIQTHRSIDSYTNTGRFKVYANKQASMKYEQTNIQLTGHNAMLVYFTYQQNMPCKLRLDLQVRQQRPKDFADPDQDGDAVGHHLQGRNQQCLRKRRRLLVSCMR